MLLNIRYSKGRNVFQHRSPELKMDVPMEYWSIANYRATLGHKTNHSFLKSNGLFVSVIHPRHGPINAIVSTRKIRKGEEILCSYGYTEHSLIPSWYANAYYEAFNKTWPGKFVYNEFSDSTNHVYLIE